MLNVLYLDRETITSEDCFLISTVAEGITLKVCIEKKFLRKKDFETICINCENHRE